MTNLSELTTTALLALCTLWIVCGFVLLQSAQTGLLTPGWAALLAFFAFLFLLGVDFFDFFDFVVFFFFVRLAMRRSLSQKSDDNAETCFRVPALRTKPEFSNCAPPK